MMWFAVALVTVIAVVALHDIFQKRRTILHNFPVIGHLRYFLEKIGPELRQYWVATDKEELPFNRSERAWVYASAKGQNNLSGFGTSEQLYSTGYPIIKHSVFPFPDDRAKYIGNDPTAVPCLKVMGESHARRRLYRPMSVINISAMSFGSLGKRAIMALNHGAKQAGCYQNTGEGGFSPYHSLGADIVFQIGTGYFGARSAIGSFSIEELSKKVAGYPQIRAIELKLSQGAKPGKGGILPGRKVTPEIAAVRGVQAWKDCISPNAHSEFHNVNGLIDFVERITDRTGLPVGIKSAVGELGFWEQLADRMNKRGLGPDFITIDGAEGGTGAAPLTFVDHVSLPFKIGFARVFQIFMSRGLTKDIVWIGSGKLGFPDRAAIAFAMGCDTIHIAREAMLAIGCIQAQRCHTDHCPAGIATQNSWLQRGLDVKDKAFRLARFIQSFRKELLSLAHAAGYEHPCQFTARDIEICTGPNRFSTLSEVLGFDKPSSLFTTMTDYGPVEDSLSTLKKSDTMLSKTSVS